MTETLLSEYVDQNGPPFKIYLASPLKKLVSSQSNQSWKDKEYILFQLLRSICVLSYADICVWHYNMYILSDTIFWCSSCFLLGDSSFILAHGYAESLTLFALALPGKGAC